jgi:hypothetical protein
MFDAHSGAQDSKHLRESAGLRASAVAVSKRQFAAKNVRC